MTRYRWNGEGFVDREGNPMPVPQRDYVPMPYVVSDIAYVSPITGKPVTSRSERREEMKRTNSREVDPSEFKPVYSDKEHAKASGSKDYEPPPKPDLGEGYERQPVDRSMLKD